MRSVRRGHAQQRPDAPRRDHVGQVLTTLLALVAGMRIGQFLWVALHRANYPFELEWLEGDMFHHALRIREGLPWYPKPGVDFVPEFYPPGYPLVCALLMFPLGESLTVLRAVSMTAILVAGALMVLFARRYSGSTASGIAGAGLFFASFAVCGSWFDVARVDSLAITLALLGTFLAGRDSGTGSYYAGILALVLSVLVKQNHLAFLVAAIPIWWVWDRKRAIGGLVVATVALGVAFVALQVSSGGWFSFYVIDLPAAVPRVWEKVGSFWREGALRVGGLALPALAWAYFSPARTSLPLLMLPVAVVVSLSGWSQTGGYLNNLIPLAAFSAIGIGVGLGRLRSSPSGPAPVSWAIQLLALGQLIALGYDTASNIPNRADSDEAWKVVERVRSLPGPILAPYHPYLLHLAGHEMGMQFHMFGEIESAKKLRPSLDDGGLAGHVERMLKRGYWTTYIGIAGGKGELSTPIDRLTLPSRAPFAPLIEPSDQRTLFPLTGNRVRPGRVYWLRGGATDSAYVPAEKNLWHSPLGRRP